MGLCFLIQLSVVVPVDTTSRPYLRPLPFSPLPPFFSPLSVGLIPWELRLLISISLNFLWSPRAVRSCCCCCCFRPLLIIRLALMAFGNHFPISCTSSNHRSSSLLSNEATDFCTMAFSCQTDWSVLEWCCGWRMALVVSSHHSSMECIKGQQP